MRTRALLALGSAVITLAAAAPADALVINLIDTGFGGTAAQQAQARAGFKIAADYWTSILTNDATINLRVGTVSLGRGPIAQTYVTSASFALSDWESRVAATRSNSTIDRTAVLPTLTNGGAGFITNGTSRQAYKDPATGVVTYPLQDDTGIIVFDNAATESSRTLSLNTAVAKAIGGTAAGVDAASVDGSVEFNSDFGFDFDPTNGIAADTFDFIGVAIHEIGHALGFASGVDYLDYYGKGNTANPDAGTLGYSLNDTALYTALDMFRYSADPTDVAPGAGASLDLSAGKLSGTKYFSIDGGKTALFGNTFAQGVFNGDGTSASHWKDTAGCRIGNGIMDPTFCYGQTGYVTGLDLAAFDAMGYNLSVDALSYANTSTATIYRQFATPVPEPATWGLMMLGGGAVGVGLRRGRRGGVGGAARSA